MIYTQDHVPVHVHAIRGNDLVVFNIDCVRKLVTVRGDTGIRSGTVRELRALVGDNLALLCEAWRSLHGER
jgi:hypothetical protein